MTPKEWCEANDVKVGDRVKCTAPHVHGFTRKITAIGESLVLSKTERPGGCDRESAWDEIVTSWTYSKLPPPPVFKAVLTGWPEAVVFEGASQVVRVSSVDLSCRIPGGESAVGDFLLDVASYAKTKLEEITR